MLAEELREDRLLRPVGSRILCARLESEYFPEAVILLCSLRERLERELLSESE